MLSNALGLTVTLGVGWSLMSACKAWVEYLLLVLLVLLMPLVVVLMVVLVLLL